MSFNLYKVIKLELRAISRAIGTGESSIETDWENVYQQIKSLGRAAEEDLASQKRGYRIEITGKWSCRDCGVIQSGEPKCCQGCGHKFRGLRASSCSSHLRVSSSEAA